MSNRKFLPNSMKIHVSLDGSNPIPVEVNPNDLAGASVSKCFKSSNNENKALIICKNRILEPDKTLASQGVSDGECVCVCTNVDPQHRTQTKILSERIEEIAMEAIKIMDFKIERVLSDPRVMASCNSCINSANDEGTFQREIYDPSVFPTEEIESGIPSKPLPMEWRSEQQLDFLAEPQEPLFSSISEARKYYSSQLTEHGWDW